jgi:lysozyme
MIDAQIIALEEGYREKPYYDHLGYPTVGYGRLLGPKNANLYNYTGAIYESAEREWLRCHISHVKNAILASSIKDAYQNCDEVRKAVLVSMAYQMGVDGLSCFKKTIKFIEDGLFDCAAMEMLESRWADQTPERAERHADMMHSGELLEFYGD